MDANKRKRRKRIVFAALVILLAALLVALPFILDARQGESTKASLLSARVTRGSIEKTLSGTGTLTEQEAQTVSVPDGVRVTDYLVNNGQFVQEGEAVATVDKVSVMEEISALREAMTETAGELESARVGSGSSTLSAPATAKVKAVYAAAGDSVEDVMLEHGALAVLSLDGLMSVSFPADAALSIGDRVSVVLSNGQEIEGRVESVFDGTVTVTISDAYGSIGETVQIEKNGQSLGSGSLAVHSAWKAMATGGTVTRVTAAEGKTAYSGAALFTISADDGSYAKLLAEYREYEDILEQLFELYQSGTVTAPCDGCVSGVDSSILEPLSASASGASARLLRSETAAFSVSLLRNSSSDARVSLLRDTGSGASVRLLSNLPNGDPNGDPNSQGGNQGGSQSGNQGGQGGNQGGQGGVNYVARVGMISAVNEDGSYTLKMQQGFALLNDLTELDTLVPDTSLESMTETYGPVQLNANLRAGDVYVFVFDVPGNLVQMNNTNVHYDLPQPNNPQNPEQGGDAGFQLPTGGGGGMGGMPSGSQTAEEERYSAEGKTILSVTPQEKVSVSITVDELDVLSVHKGQAVRITLDALPGQSFSGVITELNTTASNDGGNSKYSAVVELERTDMMLGGMNAAATITVERLENVLLIPAAALTELDGQDAVYTAYDSREETLTGLVPVETGLSDGEQVQILSGISEGDEVWYRYYDKVEISGLN